jgi:hypothetical protein
LKKEIDSTFAELNVVLSLPLHPEALRGLIVNQTKCEMQAALLLNAMTRLAGYYRQKGHPIRELNWPHAHTKFLNEAAAVTDHVC